VALDPGLINQGQRAHDQVAAFISLRRRGIVYYYAAVSFTLILSACAAFFLDRVNLAITLFVTSVIWSILCYFHWQRLLELYQANLKFLDKLYLTNNQDDFPWVKEAIQLATIREIQAEIERGTLGPNSPT
jgi:hypothetical protein